MELVLINESGEITLTQNSTAPMLGVPLEDCIKLQMTDMDRSYQPTGKPQFQVRMNYLEAADLAKRLIDMISARAARFKG